MKHKVKYTKAEIKTISEIVWHLIKMPEKERIILKTIRGDVNMGVNKYGRKG